MFWKRDVVLAQEYLAFLLLNLLDLFLTGYIFKHGGMEANGIAASIMARFHGQGFAIYKFLLVLVLILCCEIIFTKRPRTSRFIITFGCLVYLCLVLWEVYLIFTRIIGSPDAA